MKPATIALLFGWPMLVGAANLLSQPTDKLDLTFPVPAYNQEYAATGGNPRPLSGRLLMFFPSNFDPHRSWPLLVVTSTTDGERTSPMDAPAYRATANSEGWIVLATDATMRPRSDSTEWRAAVLSAALDLIHRDWPGSAQWPVVFAGFSGGAKRSEWMAAMLARSVNLAGIFLAGINDDRMPPALQNFHPPAQFFAVPIWISSGMHDPIATAVKTRDAEGSLIHLGFKNVHLSEFYGGHELDRADLRRALRWFRQQSHI
jgi:hypothetical protein